MFVSAPPVKRCLLALLLWMPLVGGLQLFAQNQTWKRILANEFVEARASVSDSLLPTADEETLLGLLFLADITHDLETFKSLARQLLLQHGQDAYLQAFQGVDIDPELLLQQAGLGERYKLVYRVMALEQRGFLASFSQPLQKLEKWFWPNKWQLIGPFWNLNGSAYDYAYPPELNQDSLARQAIENGQFVKVKWVEPQGQGCLGMVVPTLHLPDWDWANLYYAHRSFAVAQDTQLYVAISRNQPLKLWLDGELIFAQGDARGYLPDDERVQVKLSAGRHHLLVKTGSYRPNSRPVAAFDLSLSYPEEVREEPVFCVRLTDAAGHRLDLPNANEDLARGRLLGYESESDQILTAYLSRLKKDSLDWSAYYVLARLYLAKGHHEAGEAFFWRAYQAHPESVFLRTLLAAFFGRNGNRVMAFEVLDQVDAQRTPIYSLMKEQLDELNPETESEKYLAQLVRLHKAAPSNASILAEFVDYYEDQDETEKAAAFEQELEDLRAGRSTDVFTAPRNFWEEVRAGWGKNNYSELSLGKSNGRQTLGQAFPQHIRTMFRKARSHFRAEENDEALQWVDSALCISPLNADLLELRGDILKEMGEEQQAQLHFRQAFEATRNQSYYSFESLDEKLKVTKEKQAAPELFTPVSPAKLPEVSPQFADENAVILLRSLHIQVDSLGRVKVNQALAIKILTPSGAETWTEEYFSYLGQLNTVKVIKQDSAIFYPDAEGSHVVFKNLEPGDVIWVEGERNWNYYQISNDIGGDLVMTRSLTFINPVIRAQVEVAVPEGFPLHYQLTNLDQIPERSTRDHYDLYRWEIRDLPKLVEEQATHDRWAMGVELQLSNLPDFGFLSEWYAQKSFRKLAPHYVLARNLEQIIQPAMSDEEKVKAIYQYITKDITYSFVPFLQSGHEPQAPALTCTAKIGDCKDAAALMIAMLRMVGIEAHFVLLRAGEYIAEQPLPSLYTNHAIVGYVLDGKMQFLDMTTDRYPHYVLPVMDHEAWALVVRPGETEIFRLPNDQINPQKNLVEYRMLGEVDGQGGIDLQIKGRYQGIEGGRFREFLASRKKDQKADYLQAEMPIPAFLRARYESIEFGAVEDIHAPLTLETRLKGEEYAEDLYGLLVFSLPTITEREVHPALKAEQRYAMLDLGEVVDLAPVKQEIELRFPTGYRLFGVPEAVQVDNAFGSYHLSFTPIKNGIRIKRYRSFNLSKVQAKDFEAFQAYYLQTYKWDRTKLVLTKNGRGLSN